MAAVVFGKHPAFGDFLSHGLSTEACTILEQWLDDVLPTLKTGFGADWDVAWASAAPLKFWLTADLLGKPVAGLFLPSMDRVGRKYPFILGYVDIAPPAIIGPDHDERVFSPLWHHLQSLALTPETAQGVGSIVAGLTPPDLPSKPEAPKADFNLWYPVHQPDSRAGWVETDGLPDAETLKRLLTRDLMHQDFCLKER